MQRSLSMSNKEKRKASKPKQPKPSSRRSQPSYWMIAAVIAIIFSVGLTVKVTFFSDQAPRYSRNIYQTSSTGDGSLGSQAWLVASKFKCACGGCGELPLIECSCDMPRGALEEKGFINKKLKDGLSVEEVIQMVEKEYGHKIM